MPEAASPLPQRKPAADIPDGFPTSALHWYTRWAAAWEQLDEEACLRLELHARVRELEAAAPVITRDAVAAERSRLFEAIRHSIGLDVPWRGEALDLIAGIWQEAQE